MCVKVVWEEGDRESLLSTVGDLRAKGMEPVILGRIRRAAGVVTETSCLCAVDLRETARKHGIFYRAAQPGEGFPAGAIVFEAPEPGLPIGVAA